MKRFSDLIEFDDAVEIIRDKLIIPEKGEEVNLLESIGRFLSEPLFSNRNLPEFSRSKVDGFALNSVTLKYRFSNGMCKVKVTGFQRIGEKPLRLQKDDECFRIATGAPIPIGCDSVVMLEDCVEDDGYIVLSSIPVYLDNISTVGSDLVHGEFLLSSNRMISPDMIAPLSALGLSTVRVRRKIEAAIISTGNELVHPGRKKSRYMIYDSNGPVISAILDDTGVCNSHYIGIVKDNLDDLTQKVKSAIPENDILIISAGTSVGEEDYLEESIRTLNGTVHFHGVNVRPGMPFLFAEIGGKPVFGLPGFPVSSIMILRALILPELIRKFTQADTDSGKISETHGYRSNQKEHRNATRLFPSINFNGNFDHNAMISGESGWVASLTNANSLAVMKPSIDKKNVISHYTYNIDHERNIVFIYGSFSRSIHSILEREKIPHVFLNPDLIEPGNESLTNNMDILILEEIIQKSNPAYDVGHFFRKLTYTKKYGIVYSKPSPDLNEVYISCRSENLFERMVPYLQSIAGMKSKFIMIRATSDLHAILLVKEGIATFAISDEDNAKDSDLKFMPALELEQNLLINPKNKRVASLFKDVTF